MKTKIIAILLVVIVLIATGFLSWFYLENQTKPTLPDDATLEIDGVSADSGTDSVAIPERVSADACGDLRIYVETEAGRALTLEEFQQGIALDSERYESATDTFTPAEKCIMIASEIDGDFARELAAKYLTPQRANAILASAESAAKARFSVAAEKGFLSSTVSAMLLCLGGDQFIEEPTSGKPICQGNTVSWSDALDDGIKWEGCEFIIDRHQIEGDEAGSDRVTFQYCATLSSGEIMRCTEAGCTPKGIE